MLRQRAAATGAGAMVQAAFVILAHQGCGAVAAAAAGLDPTFHAGDSNGSSSVLQLSLLRQVLASSADFGWDTSTTHAEWKAEETALILIDLWNCHWCAAMSQRTADLASRVNRTASIRAGNNSRGPGGPMGPLRTPLRTPATLSRPSVTY